MQEFEKKMLREKEDLDGKINHLSKVLNSDSFRVSDEEKKMMEEQRGYMVKYLECLNKRIELHNIK